ncbi:hypothetical protein N7520_007821 [Penicillium odoratum]|uniref:uncharacterized protein n=1 Tax=Penicillium odoratum TaxID=1167516 RepID=UPI0025477691|nr:uncharacterized protein N7520_007821 [Penicillium odoratum]KAJ5760665.1 hypothetical protein N7520_007821 [Penicillium odoratum]
MNGDNRPHDSFGSDPLLAAVKVGALSGAAGLIYGGAAGVIKSPNPVIHSLSCGIHWFACGTTFWWLRSNVIKLHFQDQASPQERAAFNRVDAWQVERAQNPSKPFFQRMADSKWIPLRNLSDEEYRGMLSEKLLGIEAEIALLDEKIEDLEKTRPVSTTEQ